MKAWFANPQTSSLTLEETALPSPAPNGVVVKIESAMVLSYLAQVLDGTLAGYRLPDQPFVPGEDAVGTIIETGSDVHHLKVGDRVLTNPHQIADERVPDPAQMLIGLTTLGDQGTGSQQTPYGSLQSVWRDGVFAEAAHWPASLVTPLTGGSLANAIALSKCVVPYGGFTKAGVRAGDVVAINGATGAYGSAAALVAKAMGASRILLLGRNAKSLEVIAEKLGDRAIPVTLGGDETEDVHTIRLAADNRLDMSLDMLGNATDVSSTQSVMRSLRRGGSLGLMGSASAPLRITFGEMLTNDWTVFGKFMYERSAPSELRDLANAGLLDLDLVETTSFPIEDLPQAMEHARTTRGFGMTAISPNS